MYALINNIITLKYEAEWTKYGKSAGPRRNERMYNLSKPDLVVAFEDSKNKTKITGTQRMVDYAKSKGCNVHHFIDGKLVKR